MVKWIEILNAGCDLDQAMIKYLPEILDGEELLSAAEGLLGKDHPQVEKYRELLEQWNGDE